MPTSLYEVCCLRYLERASFFIHCLFWQTKSSVSLSSICLKTHWCSDEFTGCHSQPKTLRKDFLSFSEKSEGVSERQAEPLDQRWVCGCVLVDKILLYTLEAYMCVLVCRWNKICNKRKQSSWGCACANRWNKIFHKDNHDTWIYCTFVSVCASRQNELRLNDNPSTWSYCSCVSVLAAKELW